MTDLEMTPLMVVGALIIGAGVGVLTGLFGVGGGFLITPLLNAILGVPMPIAVGTGAVQILGTSTAGMYRRRKDGQVDYKMAIVLFGGNTVGVRLGDATIQWLKGAGNIVIAGRPVPAIEFIIQSVFVLLLAGIAGWLLYDTSRPEPEVEGLFSHLRVPPYTTFPSLGRPVSITVLSYFGLLLGFLTGLLGIGGGVVMVPALLYLVGMQAHSAAATSLPIIWFSSVVAVITKVPRGDVSLPLAMPLLIGGTIGLQAGVSICNRTSATRLKRYFAFVVIAAMVVVLAQLIEAIT